MPKKNHRLSLFQKYPALELQCPHLQLGSYPTQIHQLRHLGIENLWIKRDDQTSSVYGGNKIRKLEFILSAAYLQKVRHLITLGGIGTNHGLASAIFCQQLGIKCSLLLYFQPVTEEVKQNLCLLAKYKARLVYKKTLWRTMMYYYLFYRFIFPHAYFVYPGGSSLIGNIGYVNAAFELKDQISQGILPEPAAIFCPLSSGGSQAGLILGIQLAGLNSRVIGVRVMPSHLGPFQACTPKTVEKQIKGTYSYLKSRCPKLPDISMRRPEIMHEYLGIGYGAPSRAGDAAYHLLREKEGITLDPTYTAKTFAAVLDYCRGPSAVRGPVLYWHTYNSVDLSDAAREVDYRILPGPLRAFIKRNTVEYC